MRLPMFWPTTPLSQPSMTLPAPVAKVNAWPRSSEESNFLPSLYSAPVYWTTTFSPLSTLRPLPWIRTCDFSSVGSAAPGTGVMSNGFLPLSLTCGMPAGGAVISPLSTASGAVDCRMSRTKTRLSVAPTPSWVLPWAPNAAPGGATTSRRLPALWPVTALSRAGISLPASAWYSCGLPFCSP